MSETPLAVRLRGVSKNYIVHTKPHYWLADFLGLGRLLKEGRHYRSFWALRDIDLEIPRGAKVAFVGRNGAGKSTLLRIISENIVPTSGTVEVNGRCEALMQLGAGFNPEFTGRECVMSALAYMGIARARALERFADILEFSELDEFIDQPVRTYSSGMYLRLAFSVATVIAPEILIIDEILAAGDMYFQAKCLTRIQELTSGPGTTVLFVSHDLESARRLCDTFVWLDRGRIVAHGGASDVQAAYEHSIRKQQEIRMRARNLRLRRRTLTALQAAGEDGAHLLGQLVVEGDEGLAPPQVDALRLFVRGALAEEIRVGDAMDDNADHYKSFVLSDPAESTWSPPITGEGRLSRAVRPPSGGSSGAKFALFVHHDDFEDPGFSLDLEISYRHTSPASCHLELNAGIAGLKRALTLLPTPDGQFATARVPVPRWIYAPFQDDEGQPVRLEPAAEAHRAEAAGTAVPAHKRFGTGQLRIDHIRFLNEGGEESYVLRHGRLLDVLLTYHVEDRGVAGGPLVWAAGITSAAGLQVLALVSSADGKQFEVAPERGTLRLRFDSLLLANGQYHFSAGLFSEYDLFGYHPHFTTSPHVYDFLARTVEFVVEGVCPAESWIFRQPVFWETLE